MKLRGEKSFPNTDQGYLDAEKFADEWAGDNCGFAVVVEDPEHNELHVMDHEDVEGFMAEWGGFRLYFADNREWCHWCENRITGQVIRSRDLAYCSYVCLAGGHDQIREMKKL